MTNMTAGLLCVFLRKEIEVKNTIASRRLSSCFSPKFTKKFSTVGNNENETVVGIGKAAGGQGC
jgi:hypothetical protein